LLRGGNAFFVRQVVVSRSFKGKNMDEMLRIKIKRQDVEIELATRNVVVALPCISEILKESESHILPAIRVSEEKIGLAKEAIECIEKKKGKQVPVDDLIKELNDMGIDAHEARMIIEKLMRAGDIFRPRDGFIQKI